MKLHDLKVLPEYYRDVASGRKSFEVRKNDRGFEVGDILRLREYHPGSEPLMVSGGYTGAEVLARVDYILPGGDFGIAKDHCVMAIRLGYFLRKPLEEMEPKQEEPKVDPVEESVARLRKARAK